MNLVVLYGPPGVGKLTTARELRRLTGFKVFHNHMTLNYVSAMFDWDDTFWKLVRSIRLQMIEAAAEEGVSLVFTCVYPVEEDDEHMLQFRDAVERQGGRICPVQLFCRQDILESRTGLPGRAELHKMTLVSELRGVIENEPRMLKPLQGIATLSIDNTDVAPEEAARQIVEHYGLLKTL